MYEKYSGLPDTTKSSAPKKGQPAQRSVKRTDSASFDGSEYHQAPNRTAGAPASAKRTNTRRARVRKRKIIVGFMSLIFLALIIVAVVVLVNSCSGSAKVDLETGKFLSGVYINGMDLSGKTVDEVRAQLESNETYALSNIAISLAGEQINATISGADMNATSNLNEVIEQALSGGANQVYSTKISVDETALSSRIEAINQTSSKPPVDASVTMDFTSSGKPTPQYVEGQPGFGLDVASTVALVKQAIDAGQLQTTLTPTLTSVAPTVTLEEIQANFTQIGKFSTTYSFKGTADDTEIQREMIPNRAFNVEKAAGKINNQVVQPGKKWSFNDVVGDRTEANGWREANGIFGGDTLTPQSGGGVCQVSTTLYNALLQVYPYIQINQRVRHSIPSTYVDMGLDATVDTNHIDFIFTNKSDAPIHIFAYCTENKMYKSRKRDIYVVIYGKALPVGEEYKTRTVIVSEESPGEDVITQTNKLFVGEENILAEPRSKFVVDVFVDHYLNGKVIEPLFVVEDTYPGNPLRKQVGAKPTPTPIPSTTPTPTPTPTPTVEG